MLAQDHLTLRLIRLKSPEEWPHKRNGLCFVFPKGGAGKCQAGNVVQALSPGDVLVLNEGVGGKVCLGGEAELVFWSFSLCLEHLFPLFSGEEIPLLQRVADNLKVLRLYPASSSLAVECHRLVASAPPQFNLAHRAQLLRVAAAILCEELSTAQGQHVGFVRVEEHMMQVFEKLPVDELLSLSVPELASRFGCSRRHLNRLFHQHFGFSVAALRMEMRLIKAISLLRDRDAKVINVAEQCGFNHLGLFNTCFKRRFGTSPGQWRKSGLQGKASFPGAPMNELTCPLRPKGLCPMTGELGAGNPVQRNPLAFQPQETTKLLSAGRRVDGDGQREVVDARADSTRDSVNRHIFRPRP